VDLISPKRHKTPLHDFRGVFSGLRQGKIAK